jgi:hypothetical protein
VAYTFENVGALLDRYVLLRDQEIAPAVCIAHGVTTSIYYQDPDANFVEMQIDNFSTPADATQLHARSGIRERLSRSSVRSRSDAGGPPRRYQRRGTHRPRVVAASRLARSDVDLRRRVKNPTRSIPTFAEIGWGPTSFGRTTSTAVDIVEGIRAIGTAAAARRRTDRTHQSGDREARGDDDSE